MFRETDVLLEVSYNFWSLTLLMFQLWVKMRMPLAFHLGRIVSIFSKIELAVLKVRIQQSHHKDVRDAHPRTFLKRLFLACSCFTMLCQSLLTRQPASHMCTRTPSLGFLPVEVFAERWVELLVPCSQFSLLFCFVHSSPHGSPRLPV